MATKVVLGAEPSKGDKSSRKVFVEVQPDTVHSTIESKRDAAYVIGRLEAVAQEVSDAIERVRAASAAAYGN